MTWRPGWLAVLTALLCGPVHAEGDGKTAPVKRAAGEFSISELWSGYHYASKQARELQDSDADNPARELIRQGEELWRKPEGEERKSCETCHANASRTMKGTATRYPAYFKLSNAPISIPERINLCRERYMGVKALPSEDDALLALTVYVKNQSKGMALEVPGDGPVEKFLKKGQDYYTARRGQLDISCSHCHDKYAGRMYRAEKLSQGHANGFPAYRRSWKETGSLLRQVNQCLGRLRANPLQAGSDEFRDLELYLAWRGNGLQVETPAVRD